MSKTGWTSSATGDDAQDLAGRRLLLQRLGEFAVARLQLLEQPRVLDGDDGLVGEGLESSICLSVKGAASARMTTKTPMRSPSRSSGDGEGPKAAASAIDPARVFEIRPARPRCGPGAALHRASDSGAPAGGSECPEAPQVCPYARKLGVCGIDIRKTPPTT